MSKQYSCDLCKNIFNDKIDLIKHQNKISQCTTIDNMQDLIQTNQIKIAHKKNLSTLFNYCLDLLRINEHLTGSKALKEITYWLVLRLLEPHFGNRIDIDNYEYDFNSYFEEDVIEYNKQRLLSIVRFSNLSNEKEDDIPNLMKNIWDIILSVHPITKNIFLKEEGFHIQHQSTFTKLIEKIYTFDFEAIEDDILGEAYEEVISNTMTGKVDGQFFTITSLKDFCIYLINPQLKIDGTIETIFDPAMGTGGFLISSLRHLQKQSKSNDIPINWEYIINEGLGGREAVAETHQLAVSNMLISSGYTFNNLEKDDSIRNPIINKYDIILTNPPYGIRGLIYDEILNPLRNEYMPIKSNSAVPLFLQLIIYMLKINGRCAVVLPNGQELFNKGKELVSVREYLMKTCDLKEIYLLPSGIFTHTSIRTCIFYFIKKREGSDILETKIKLKKREYIFSNIHQTTNVIFYDLKLDGNKPTILVDVPIEKIANNSYSLNFAEYIESDEQQYENSIIVKTLGEVCSIDYGTRIIKGNNIEGGEYPVYGSGRAMFSTTSFNREGYNILIGRFALSLECIRFINEKIFLNDSGLSIRPKIDILLHKYIGYYLLHNQNIIYGCARGTAQKNLEMDAFKSIKIPIPSLERQQEIVKYLDFIYEKTNKTSNEKIVELKMLNEFCLNNQKNFGENVVKSLGEVCEIEKNLKKYDTSYGKSEGKYKFHTGGERTDLYVDECDIKELYIIQNRTNGSGKCNLYLDKNFSLAKQTIVYRALNKDENTTKYIYYYLLFNKEIIEKGFIGANHKNISKVYISNIKIPIPSLEKQQEIVKYCEYNDTLIKQLEKEIENNKKLAHQFITDIVKLQVNASSENQDDINSVITEDINVIQEEISSGEEEKKDDIIEEPKQKPKNKKMPKKKRFVIVEDN
jgi:type I restriction-modification system DNA methylase subunit